MRAFLWEEQNTMMYEDFNAGNTLHSVVEKVKHRQIVYDRKGRPARLLVYVHSAFINSIFVSLQYFGSNHLFSLFSELMCT